MLERAPNNTPSICEFTMQDLVSPLSAAMSTNGLAPRGSTPGHLKENRLVARGLLRSLGCQTDAKECPKEKYGGP